jgi:hypothetical protein
MMNTMFLSTIQNSKMIYFQVNKYKIYNLELMEITVIAIFFDDFKKYFSTFFQYML